MSVVLPTHTCFDDAAEYVSWRLSQGREHYHIKIVHGIALFPEGQPGAGTRFSHAWVEEDGHAITGGIFLGARCWVRQDIAAFYRRMRVEKVTKYSIFEALEQDGTTGPWEHEYRLLCRDSQEAKRA